ncbi:hypothetical protein H4R26_003629 [Coemansia thaxteri]|uniref:Uncharacterized protein n=1 Tax=Coemansia thaxteri TaxID=2663907 RepID=A0A9W8EIZ8_9FUNG|nr:hypothetical protein H4R26_003629 [Coemansia thaxteri]
MTEHFALLKRYWPQYKQWTTNSGKPHGCDDGLQGIERLVRGHMTLRLPELRDVYGLSPNQSLGDSPFYYDYCDRILKLAERERLAVSGRMPERLLFNKSLHAFALAGDLRSIIYHMEQHRMLCDIATWTEVVRCICVQILGQPLNSRMICPQSAKYSTWVEFILSLEPLLAARGIRFSQVTFGQMIQTATLLYDAGAILRIVSWMIQRTTVRFNAGMLKMVIGLDVPFDLKCSLVKSTLGGKLLGIDRPTVRPDNKLLALVVRLAKRSEDLDHLPDIVALFHDGYGVSMLLSDYDYLIALCKQLNLHAELKYWMHCKAIAHVN